METPIESTNIYVDEDDSVGTASSAKKIDIPFTKNKTNKRSALFWTQLAISTVTIGIGTAFTITGILSTNVFIPMLSSIVAYWLPAPSL